MKTHRNRRGTLLFGVVLGVTFCGLSVHAGDCSAVVKSLRDTMQAPAIRQFLSFSGESKDERLLSITVEQTVYLATGGANGWITLNRSVIRKTAMEAEGDADYRDCNVTGNETAGGMNLTVYAFTKGSKRDKSQTYRGEVWIGADGLIRKQKTEKGSVRYEYERVTAPVL